MERPVERPAGCFYTASPPRHLGLDRPHRIFAEAPDREVRGLGVLERIVPERALDADAGFPRRRRHRLVPAGRREARRMGELAGIAPGELARGLLDAPARDDPLIIDGAID